MSAVIVVNQVTRPAGTPGKARSDGVISQLVTCTNNTVEGSYLWTLVDVPIRSALVRGSTSTSSSFTFTPDVKGTYLVSLRVNGSTAPGDNDSTYIAVRSFGAKSMGWRYQGAGETTEDNEDYAGLGFPGNINPRGWATNEDDIFEDIEESVWETDNAVTSYGGVQERLVKTDPATGRVSPTLIAGVTPTGPAGQDVQGNFPNALTVVALRGRSISNVFNPTDGQALVWRSAGSAWRPEAVGGGTGGTSMGISAGTESVNSGLVAFADSNGVSFGMSGSSQITASIPAGATATGNLGALGAGTQTQTSGTVVFSNSNNVTFGLNNGTVTASISATQSTAPSAFAAGTQTVTSGTVVLSNSNGLSFGMNAGTVTGSYTVPSTAGLISAVNLSAGTTSGNVTAFTLSNSNNVSFGLNAGTVTASVPSGATATGNFGAVAGGTQTATSGTVAFSNSNGVSFGLSGSSRMTASVDGIKSISAGTTRITNNEAVFSNSNNVSFGANGQTITASASFAQSTAPAALAAGTQTATSGTINFANSNGLTFGMSGSSQITGSYTVPSTAGLISAVNVSAGTTSNNLTALTFSNSNGVSFGLNGSVVTASITPGAAAINISAGTTSTNAGAFTFSNSNNVSFGLNGQTVTGSVPAGVTATGNFGALAAGTQTATSGTVGFADSNGISFGMSGSSQITASYTVPSTAGLISRINVSGGTTSNNLSAITFSNSNNVSFGLNGSTMTASVPAGATATGNFGALAAGTQTGTSGTVNFANSNGISFGMSNSTQITASYTVPSTAGLISSINVSGGTTSNNLTNFVLSNSNNVSFGLNGSTFTASASYSQSTAPGAFAAGTQTGTSGTIRFADSNGISFGMSQSTQITASYTVPSVAGLISAVNLSAGTTSNNLTAFVASNSNNVSFGLNGSTLTASATFAQSTAPGALAAGTQTGTSGTIVFSNSNNVTFGMSGSTRITASVASSLTNINVSAGTTSNNLSALTFSNSNGVSFGLNGSVITASVTPGGGGGGGVALSAGANSASNGTVTFTDQNNLFWGLDAGSKLTASAPFNLAVGTTSRNLTAATLGDNNGISFGYDPGGNTITASHDGIRVVSAGTTSQIPTGLRFSNTNGISWGIGTGTASTVITASHNGITAIYDDVGNSITPAGELILDRGPDIVFRVNDITASAHMEPLYTYEPYAMDANTGTGVLTLTTATSGPMYLIPFNVIRPVAAEYLRIVVSMNMSLSGAVESWSQSGSLGWGIFSRGTGTGHTTLSAFTSSSLSYGMSWQNSTMTINQVTSTHAGGVYSTGSTTSAGNNLSSAYTGLKLLELGIGTTIPTGYYWLGIHGRASYSSVSSRGIQMSIRGHSMSLNGLAPMGSFSSAFSTGTNVPLDRGGNFKLGLASVTQAGLSSLLTVVSMSQMTQNLPVIPHMMFASRLTA